MTKPVRKNAAPKKPTKSVGDRPKSLDEKREEEAEVKTTPPDEQVPVEETVDKDAIIKALQEQVASSEEQAKKVKELQDALKKAEESAGKSANMSTEEFKLRPDPDDAEEFYYFDVIWHPKRSDADEEFVVLGVNGKFITFARNKSTVIRSDYLEVADNAFVPKFKQLPGEDRKEVGGLKPYTYTINRKIDEEEYYRRKKEGDKALRDDLISRGTPV